MGTIVGNRSGRRFNNALRAAKVVKSRIEHVKRIILTEG